MKKQIIRPDPFSREKCSRNDCRTISKGKNGTGCRETCFQGNVKSARVYYEQFKGHMDNYRQKKGFMWKHAEEVNDESKDLSFFIIREAVDPDPMRRIVRESVRINQSEWRSDVDEH